MCTKLNEKLFSDEEIQALNDSRSINSVAGFIDTNRFTRDIVDDIFSEYHINRYYVSNDRVRMEISINENQNLFRDLLKTNIFKQNYEEEHCRNRILKSFEAHSYPTTQVNLNKRWFGKRIIRTMLDFYDGENIFDSYLKIMFIIK